MEKLSVVLDWFPNTNHTGYLLAESVAGSVMRGWRWTSAATYTGPCTSTGPILSAVRRSPCWTVWSRGKR